MLLEYNVIINYKTTSIKKDGVNDKKL